MFCDCCGAFVTTSLTDEQAEAMLMTEHIPKGEDGRHRCTS